MVSGGRRLDIDGLRGVACLIVAAFHFWFGRASGGVDVFMTITGFFFISSLLRRASIPQHEFSAKNFSPIPNLKNLLKRLLPSMITVLAAVSVLTIIFEPKSRWQGIFDEVKASLLYYQNWKLGWNAESYLAASTSASPLQHIWSMSVQGQFYIGSLAVILGLGLILRLIFRTGGARQTYWILVAIVCAATISSFIFAAWEIQNNASMAYYNTWGRIWEPLAGAVAAIFAWRIKLPRIAREILALIGIVAIFSIAWIVDGNKVFPGPWALVPVLGALFIIIGWDPKNYPDSVPLVNRILGSKPIVWMGSISYALYLWHWPMLVFYLVWRDRERSGPFSGTAMLIASILLAWLTTRFIENPIRYSGRPSIEVSRSTVSKWIRYRDGRNLGKGWLAGVYVLLITLVVGMASTNIYWNNKLHTEAQRLAAQGFDPSKYPGAQAYFQGLPSPHIPILPQPSLGNSDAELPITSLQRCIMDFNVAGMVVCDHYGDPTATRTIVLAGASHSEHWITALDEIGKKEHFKVITILRMGCELTRTKDATKNDGSPYDNCFSWVPEALNKIKEIHPNYVFTTTTRPNVNGPGDYTPPGYLEVFNEFKQEGIPVLGIRDTPWQHDDVPDCLSEHNVVYQDDVRDGKCGQPFNVGLSVVNPVNAWIAQYPNVHPIDMTNGLCSNNYCPAVIGNVIVYHDFHHLTRSFVETLVPQMSNQIGKATGWWKTT